MIISTRRRRLPVVALATAIVAVLLATVTSPAAATGDRFKDRPIVPGMIYTESNRSFDETWDTLVAALEANPNINLIAQVDHEAAANSVGLELEPNRVAVFGNPALGAPLMAINQKTGIDLPQKMHVFEDDGRVWVGFNDTNFLARRFWLGKAPTLDTINGALRNLAGGSADADVRGNGVFSILFRFRPGLVTVTSDADVDTTWDRLLGAFEASPASIAFTVDHGAAANNAGIELRPTRLAVFGNPNLGTPFMQERPTAGVDLPLKILVWEDESGKTRVTTNSTTHLWRRHRFQDTSLDPVRTALGNFLNAATGTNG